MSERIIVATRKGLFTCERGTGGRWGIARAEFLGDNVTYALTDPRDGWRYAALDHGHFGCKLHRSAGPDAVWEECAVPVYPKQPEGQVDKDPMGRTIPWTLSKMWVIEPGGPGEFETLWTGTLPGGLFRSRDRGASWEMMRALWDHPLRKHWMGGGYELPGIHSIAVDPRDARVIRVGVSTGGVWITWDAGTSWNICGSGMRADWVPPEVEYEPNAQDVHRLVQSADPDEFWVQHHNGIFRSTDACASWSELTNTGPSKFGFAAVAHPAQPGTAWFVPAIKDERRIPVDGRMVVTRTRDGGTSFDVLSEGLPQLHAYHLVYRHGLAIDATGTRLAMGSTTGGLWVSETSGENWSNVSQDLPPIHSVRFA
jgi:hypothetical protein